MKFDQSNNCNGGLWVGLSNGARFNTSQWGTWCTPADIKVFAGDFNGDGRTDVMKIDRSDTRDRKSTRLNSSHLGISYAVFCLKKKKYSDKEPVSRCLSEISHTVVECPDQDVVHVSFVYQVEHLGKQDRVQERLIIHNGVNITE